MESEAGGVSFDVATPSAPIKDDHDYIVTTSKENTELSDLEAGIISLILTLIQKQFDIASQLSLQSQSDVERSAFLKLILKSLRKDVAQNSEESFLRLQPTVFKEQFRISTSTFEVLVQRLSPSSQLERKPSRNGGRIPIPVSKAILIGLWVLGTQESYRSTSERFNVTQSTVFRSIQKFCGAILEILTPDYIKWPDEQEKAEIEARFRETFKTVNVIGVVGNLHVPIDTPKSEAGMYVNDTGFHSVQLQAVCDLDSRFRNCYAGFPGSLSINDVMEESELNSIGEELCAPNYKLIGNSAYALKKWLIIPAVSEDPNSEDNVNNCLHNINNEIEKTFLLLTSRFKRLQGLNIKNLDDLTDIIIALCTLHNVCLEHEDCANDWISNDDDMI